MLGITFIYIFLPITLFIHQQAPMKRKNAVLFMSSLLLYGWCDPTLLLALIFSLPFNYFFGLSLERQERPLRRKLLLAAGIFGNLLPWGFYKLAPFLSERLAFPCWPSPLPAVLGFSLYTVQAVGYLTDIFRGESRAQTSFIAYSVFAAMFPKMPAGPALRSQEVRHELARRPLGLTGQADGVWRFTMGLAKKLLLADSLSGAWRQLEALPRLGAAAAWLGIAIFGLALYFELSSLCDMAVGLGKLLGFSLPESFELPYTALSLRDFWRRWQSSLYSFLKTNLPFNQKAPLKAFFLVLAGCIAGLCYGFHWTALAWGGCHGLLLAGERCLWGKALEKAPPALRRGVTLLLVLLGWALLSSKDAAGLWEMFGALFGKNGGGLRQALSLASCCWFALVLAWAEALGGIKRLGRWLQSKSPRLMEILRPIAAAVLMLLCTAFLVGAPAAPLLLG